MKQKTSWPLPDAPIPVVNRRTAHPIEGDVYIGRPGPFGNPYAMRRDTPAERERVIALYVTMLADQPQLVELLAQQKPKRLVCWCAPKPCHGDVLAEALAYLNAA